MEQDKEPTIHIEGTDEQKIRLKGNLKLMEEAQRTGRDFHLFDYLEAIDPDPNRCKEGPFTLLSQKGDLQKYRCEKCGAHFIQRASVSEKDWQHYKPGCEPTT